MHNRKTQPAASASPSTTTPPSKSPSTTPASSEALADATLPKDVHDLKAVLRALEPHNVTLDGVRDDVMLLSYLINPTHGSHTLPDIAARSTSRALVHQPTKDNPDDPKRLPEAAAAIVRLATILGQQIADYAPTSTTSPPTTPHSAAPSPPRCSSPTRRTLSCRHHLTAHHVYDTIDLPLVPVLLRMEQAGVRIDPAVLRAMSTRLAVEIDNLAETHLHRLRPSLQHQLPQATRRRPLQQDAPPQAHEVRQGQGRLHRAGRPRRARRITTPSPRSSSSTASSQSSRAPTSTRSPQLADAEGRVHTTFNQVGTATGRLSSTNPNLQNIPVRTAVGREIRAAFIAAPGNVLMSADYSQIELRLMAHFSQDPLLLDAYRTGKDIHTLTAAEVFGVDADDHGQGDPQPRQGRQLRHRLRHQPLRPRRAARHRSKDREAVHRNLLRSLQRRPALHRRGTLDTVRREQAVRTSFGRVRPIPDIQSRNPNMRGFAERTAVNTPLQGTAADLIKLAMLRIDADHHRSANYTPA